MKHSRLVTILGLLVTAEAAPDLGHGDHAAHNNAILDSGAAFSQSSIIHFFLNVPPCPLDKSINSMWHTLDPSVRNMTYR